MRSRLPSSARSRLEKEACTKGCSGRAKDTPTPAKSSEFFETQQIFGRAAHFASPRTFRSNQGHAATYVEGSVTLFEICLALLVAVGCARSSVSATEPPGGAPATSP